MRPVFLLLVSTLIYSLSFSQSVTLKAYVQSVLPGTIPKGITREDGTPRNINTDTKEQYYVYLLHNKNKKVIPVEMWLEGKAFAVNPKSITAPVELNTGGSANPKKITLVPKTNDKVIQLLPLPIAESKATGSAQTKAKTNQVVLVYKLKGSFYTVALKTITRLEPRANE